MGTNPYRSHSITAALAAAFVTMVLVSSLVESFEPAQLLRFKAQEGGDQIVALERRRDASVSHWT